MSTGTSMGTGTLIHSPRLLQHDESSVGLAASLISEALDRIQQISRDNDVTV